MKSNSMPPKYPHHYPYATPQQYAQPQPHYQQPQQHQYLQQLPPLVRNFGEFVEPTAYMIMPKPMKCTICGRFDDPKDDETTQKKFTNIACNKLHTTNGVLYECTDTSERVFALCNSDEGCSMYKSHLARHIDICHKPLNTDDTSAKTNVIEIPD